MTPPKIALIGGGGFYGRYLLADLLKFTNADLLAISRHPPATWPAGWERVQSVSCDLRDLAALEKAIDGCVVVANCAGPFDLLPLNPLKAALKVGAAYVDIAEDRTFHKAVQNLLTHPPAKTPVLCGLSVSPAMEALFLELARPLFDTLTSCRTFAAPDTRKHRGPAMFHTMLRGVGHAFWQPGGEKLRQVWGWTEPEWVDFPTPVGRRLTYLVLEMANLDLLPALFGVNTVEFKAGTEWPILNRLLNLSALFRKAVVGPSWEALMPFVRGFSWLMGRAGKDEGGVFFEITGTRHQQPKTHRFAVMADHDGGLIPSVLAGIAAQRLLSGQITSPGLIPIHQWISPADLLTQLAARGLALWWKASEKSAWEAFDDRAYQKQLISDH